MEVLRRFRRFRSYVTAFGLRNALLFALDRVLRRTKIRSLTISGEDLQVRSNTSDLIVAISSLMEGEYDNVECVCPSVIIDAGANIGTSAIAFARRFPKSRVFAIEPENENYELLRKNTAPYMNIFPIKAAIWGEEQVRSIRSRFTGPWGYTISETEDAAEPTGQSIRCVTVESILQAYDLEWIDILKMDIEGGEKSVFDACGRWIDKVGVLVVELHDRISMGCSRSFYLATKGFERFEKHGEKVIAYRKETSSTVSFAIPRSLEHASSSVKSRLV